MKRTVLVVDDEADFTDMVKLRLEAAGYQVETAADGEDGLSKALECEPRLILLDIMMPGMDGIEALRRLRADERTKEIPVIMLTAKGDGRSAFQCRALGCKGFLTKPCLPELLIRTVRDRILR